MKSNWLLIAVTIILVLGVVNIMLFAKTIAIGDSIAKLESQTHDMKIENMDLEQKYYTLTSYDVLTKEAQVLGFTNQTQPINLHNFTYALAK